jgi:hypothetical protein
MSETAVKTPVMKKMVVVLNVNPDFANKFGIQAGIEGAYGPDEVTVQQVMEFDVDGNEDLGLTAAAIIGDIENYADQEDKDWTPQQIHKIAEWISDSESFGGDVCSEIPYAVEDLKESGDF